MKIIAQGAEAVIKVEDGVLHKERIPKSYRIPEIDHRLRKQRTRSEAKLLQKAQGITPRVFSVDEQTMTITMEYLQGDVLKNIFDDLPEHTLKKLLHELGKAIARLHDQDIIHGDLTTTNVLVCDDAVRLVDFGLGMISKKIEDKAVDLYLLRQALHSKHYQHGDAAFHFVLEGYKLAKDHALVFSRLEKIQKRGRYKQKAQIF